MSFIQIAADIIGPVSTFHVIEGLVGTGFLTFSLGVLRLFHRGQVKTTEQFGEVRGDIQTLKKSFETRMEHTPTITSCQIHTQDLERVVRKEHRSVVDQAQAIMTDQDRKIEKLDDAVDELSRRDAVRTDRNGVE